MKLPSSSPQKNNRSSPLREPQTRCKKLNIDEPNHPRGEIDISEDRWGRFLGAESKASGCSHMKFVISKRGCRL